MNAQQDNSGDKNSMNIVWGVVTVFIVLGLIWQQNKSQILAVYLQLKKYELYILDIFSYIPFVSYDETIAQMIDYINENPYSEDIDFIEVIAETTGFYLNFVLFFFASICLTYVWRKNVLLRYKTAHDLNTLVTQEQNNWPQIMPVAKLKLIDEDINQGAWAMGMNPLQFVKHHDLIDVETIADRKTPWKVQGVKKANLRKEKAVEVFRNQMGPLWEGEDFLPPHTKALFALFLARIEHDTKNAKILTEDLAISHARGKPDYSFVSEVLKKHIQSKAVAKCVRNHAFVSTVMASMLELARTDGVLPSADFIWLKPIDRMLWYTLNTVGRQTPYCEVAGPFAHLKAEKELGRPLFKPVIQQAVEALDIAIQKVIYTDENDE